MRHDMPDNSPWPCRAWLWLDDQRYGLGPCPGVGEGEAIMNTLKHSGAARRPGFNLTVQIILAVWLVLSPFVIGYAIEAALWNTLIAGVAMIVLALLRARIREAGPVWFLNLLPGASLIMAPFLFEYPRTAMFWNSVVVGALAVAFAARSRGAVPGADLG